MAAILPINVENLLHRRSVESARVEFKAGWDEKTTGPQVVKTICAFANDFQNLNGGYVVLGVRELEGGVAELPPVGLEPAAAETAEKWIRGHCQAMRPAYEPVFSREWIGDRLVLVIWASASAERPHQAPNAPKDWRYWIRIGAETIAARAHQLEQLLEQTSHTPWDDRPATAASIDDLRTAKVREYLHDVRSGLVDSVDSAETYRRMQITTRINEHEVPRNVGLLFFSENPDQWFRGARIEVVRFTGDAARVQDERVFRGALPDQVRNCLLYLESLSQAHLEKPHRQSQVRGWVSYPHDALREAVVNAVYHRSYRPNDVEPTKIFLHPDRMEIISYPGPVPGIELEQLNNGTVPPLPARNRRIGEFLKELKLAEGRLTGLRLMRSAMAGNGSAQPRFDFDEGRRYFRVTLPAHPEYSAIQAIQDAAYLRTVGNEGDAFERIRSAWEANEDSAVLAAELVRLHADRGYLDLAQDVYRRFEQMAPPHAVANVLNTLIDACLASGQDTTAMQLLAEMPETTSEQDAVDTAILARRLREPQIAHRYFQRAGDAVLGDSRALHEFAQTKMFLAQQARGQRSRSWREVNHRLLVEARESLERVLQMDSPVTRHAWAWRDLARVRDWLQFPAHDVESAYAEAIRRVPDEQRFEDELTRFRGRLRDRGPARRRPRRNGRRPNG